MKRTFDVERERGKGAEIAVSGQYQREGRFVLPSYDYSGDGDNKAPILQCGNRRLILPDLLTFLPGGRKEWVEVKLKDETTLYRKTQTIETGLSLRHFHHYQQVQQVTGIEVSILFVHLKEKQVVGATLDELNSIGREYTGDKMGRGRMWFVPYAKLDVVWPLDVLSFVGAA